MKQQIFTIIENKPLTESVYRLRLGGNTSAITAPGQFVNIKLEGKYLRRPISVCDRSGSMLTLIYKNVGKGTEQLSTLQKGQQLDLLIGLGNGYDLAPSGERPLLIGGGVGVPPLFALADELLGKGCKVTAILGFNTASEIFYADEFRMLGVETYITTVDGSAGIKGFVTDAMKELDYSYFYTCGPEPMLKAVYRASKTEGQFSFEKRMGCGFGACMGCSCRTITGYKRICKEGPVLKKEEILWED
ncbi:MAG: dihydroorotate dehydrogenase electron transfer subunit [Anaerolineaceae bacterium]|nr:dihydroorotate dehydrogenase electron transfer subunit [Anaerolineaceae bacterium]